jgi:hypothetical protein
MQKAMEKAATDIVKKEWRAELKEEYTEHMKLRDKDYETLKEVLESTTKR